MAIGRISGPLLKANLLREGVDLAFESDLLYLDVNNARIGINTDSPQYDLDVSGTTRTTSLEVSNQAQISNVSIVGNNISTDQSVLSLGTADNVIYQNKLTVDDIDIENNVIKTNTLDKNLEIRPNGSGTLEVFADTNVYGNIVATGSITAFGDITIGDADTDNVQFNAEVSSDIIPDQSDTYNLGSDPTVGGNRWQSVYTKNAYVNAIETETLEVNGINIGLRQGNIIYVAVNGDDASSGTHQNDPYKTIKHALNEAVSGDTVLVYPGTYIEIFPLEIPTGVTLKGFGLRSVTIKPTEDTNTNDAIFVNGETTVEGLTITDFYDAYAFRFSDQFRVSTRSPYLKNISVITRGSLVTQNDPRGFDSGDAGKGALIDGSVADALSKEASCLFHSVTFITPGVTALEITNGARVEWLNSFTYFADKSIHAYDGTLGLKGTGQTSLRVDDVTGTFSQGDTITYYDSDGITVIASSVIDRVSDSGKIFISGKEDAFETFGSRPGKTATTVNGAHLSQLQKKYGSSSLSLNGENEYVQYSSFNDFGFGISNFTIETWIYPTSSSTVSRIFDFRAGAITDNAVSISLHSLTPRVFINGAYQIIGTASLDINSWSHLAYVRNGSQGTLYLNGQSVGTWNDTIDYGTVKPLTIGSLYDGSSSFFEGYLDEIRISKSIARYVNSFAPPSAEFLSDNKTVLLLHFNGDDSSDVIVDDSSIVQDVRFSSGATAKFITLTDFTDFGGEIRSIASASVYGNYGAYGQGPGVLMYLISHNFAYIGNGRSSSNDNNTVVQQNEVIELDQAKVRYNSVDHKGDFRVGDLFYVNQESGEVTFTSSELNVQTTSGLNITTNNSTTSITGEFVSTGNLRINENTIFSDSGDIILDADSETVRIISTGSLTLPSGTSTERPAIPEKGTVRYNTDVDLFEGYDGDWRALNGVYDLDLDTYITPELNPGDNDDTLRFYIGGVERVTVNGSELTTPRIRAGDVIIENNSVSAANLNQALNITSSGSGSILVDNISIKDSSITNTEIDGVLTFKHTGQGYFKISGTSGFVVPVGTNIQRPSNAYRETGMTRFNTEQGFLEIWDGNSWTSVAGETGSINFTTAEDLAIEYVLTLG